MVPGFPEVSHVAVRVCVCVSESGGVFVSYAL
jgi:hypothetical protein